MPEAKFKGAHSSAHGARGTVTPSPLRQRWFFCPASDASLRGAAGAAPAGLRVGCRGGKTRLAVEVACRLAGSFEDGVWLVELVEIEASGLVATAVAGVVRVAELRRMSVPGAAGWRHVLMVLDNCEQVHGAGLPGYRPLLTPLARGPSTCLHLKRERETDLAGCSLGGHPLRRNGGL
jgi:hypothetical protein